MCNMLYSRASGRAGLLPIHVHAALHVLGWGILVYQYPHHGWHLWSSSQCSLSFFIDFCALWPEGYIFLVHILILSLLCLKASYDLSAPESSPSSLAWPLKRHNCLSSTVGLWTLHVQQLLSAWPLSLLVCLIGSCSPPRCIRSHFF